MIEKEQMHKRRQNSLLGTCIFAYYGAPARVMEPTRSTVLSRQDNLQCVSKVVGSVVEATSAAAA